MPPIPTPMIRAWSCVGWEPCVGDGQGRRPRSMTPGAAFWSELWHPNDPQDSTYGRTVTGFPNPDPVRTTCCWPTRPSRGHDVLRASRASLVTGLPGLPPHMDARLEVPRSWIKKKSTGQRMVRSTTTSSRVVTCSRTKYPAPCISQSKSAGTSTTGHVGPFCTPRARAGIGSRGMHRNKRRGERKKELCCMSLSQRLLRLPSSVSRSWAYAPFCRSAGLPACQSVVCPTGYPRSPGIRRDPALPTPRPGFWMRKRAYVRRRQQQVVTERHMEPSTRGGDNRRRLVGRLISTTEDGRGSGPCPGCRTIEARQPPNRHRRATTRRTGWGCGTNYPESHQSGNGQVPEPAPGEGER